MHDIICKVCQNKAFRKALLEWIANKNNDKI